MWVMAEHWFSEFAKISKVLFETIFVCDTLLLRRQVLDHGLSLI